MKYLENLNFHEIIGDLLYKEIKGNNFVSNDARFYTKNSNSHFQNTEVLIKKSSETLLICVGESWTYGDSLLPYVKASENLDNLPYRIGHNFSGRLANYLKSDLLLTAVPGWSSFEIFNALEKILENKELLKKYKKINIVTQLSSPGRDYGEDFSNHQNLYNLFNHPTKKYNWDEWHKEHDTIYLNWYQKLKNINPRYNFVLWRNFNDFNLNDFSSYSFNVVKDPCMKYLINLNGMEVKLAKNLEHSFFKDINQIPTLQVSKDELIQYLREIDYAFEKLAESELNEWHMNVSGHWVWMVKLLNYIN